MKRVSRFFNAVAVWQVGICSWGMVVTGIAMTVIILIQIFFRFVVYRPVPWSEEAARYLMIWMGMLGSVIALRKGRHIGVTALVDILPAKVSFAVGIFVRVSMAGLLGIIAYYGFKLAVFNYSQLSAAMEIPMMIPYMAIPVGSAMMIVDLIAELLNEFWPVAPDTQAGIITRAPDLQTDFSR